MGLKKEREQRQLLQSMSKGGGLASKQEAPKARLVAKKTNDHFGPKKERGKGMRHCGGAGKLGGEARPLSPAVKRKRKEERRPMPFP